jgi:3-isopropylmalate dehydratase small subunit
MIILNKYRVSNIKKFRAFMFTLVLITSLIIFMIISSSFTKVYSENILKFEHVYVEKGDSLWKIASQYNNNLRIDDFIHTIERLNNIKNSEIYPGDTLVIPIY